MSSSSVALPSRVSRTRARTWSRSLIARRPELLALLVLAAALNLWALSRNGYANEYYSAAVRSMSTSWHAFLYGSFDGGGVMTVDKPPLALWVQALSVRAFGYSSWSMLVPQALMGVASVGLAYDLTRRCFGRVAGFSAGLVLVLTPTMVAVSRHNNPDALLVLCCIAALWFVVRGLQDGRTRWLVLSGVMVGLGFEAKMAAALMVVPGIAAAWLWIAPRGRLVAVRQLLAGGAAMVAVGAAWPLLVSLTPVADRPWISGTSDNSVWSLMLGYNGLGRLLGQAGGPGGGGAGGPGGGGGNIFFGGDPGPLRLLNASLGGQGGWLLGFALVAGMGLLALTRLRRADARTGWLLAVGGSAAVTAVAFSEASGIFHPYYVSLLAPFAAALVGAGVGEIHKGGHVARVLGPLAIAGGVATEIAVLHNNPGQLSWLPAVLVIGGLAASVALGVPTAARRVRSAALAAALGLLLLAPASWAVDTLGHPANGTFPTGGPTSATMGGRLGGGPGGGGGGRPPGGRGFGGAPPAGAPTFVPGRGAPPAGRGLGGGAPGGGIFGGDTTSLNAALAYAKQHGGGTVAISSQTGAAGSLIASGANVAGIGGFSGRESEVSVAWLADAAQSGRIHWVLTSTGGGGGRPDSRTGSTPAMTAVAKSCTAVSSITGLYDCSQSASALRAAS
jgi:4-amino-4-deoxy-L-arabinose transferase-like glycosyltransferase